jgi:hypothetical protein|tara:strand:- start:700 stop:1113 length:414 start_codon:yes stop_codon:yes gene_type:complete
MRKLALVLIFFLLAATIVSHIMITENAPTKITIPMRVNVDNTPGSVGFDTGTELLTFGRLGSGSTSKRTLKIENNENYPQKVTYSFTGELAPWVNLLAEYYLLDPQTMMEIPVTLTVPSNTSTGNHTGEMTLLFKKK